MTDRSRQDQHEFTQNRGLRRFTNKSHRHFAKVGVANDALNCAVIVDSYCVNWASIESK